MSLSLDASSRRHPSCTIPTRERFANPSEEVFARLLNLYGVAWVYEPVEFPLAWDEHGNPTRGFRPDFYLPDSRTFIELTVLEQRLVTKKNRKIREFRALYPEFPIEVVYRSDFETLARRHGLAWGECAARVA